MQFVYGNLSCYASGSTKTHASFPWILLLYRFKVGFITEKEQKEHHCADSKALMKLK